MLPTMVKTATLWDGHDFAMEELVTSISMYCAGRLQKSGRHLDQFQTDDALHCICFRIPGCPDDFTQRGCCGFFTVHPGSWGSPLPGNSSNSCYDNPMVWPLKVVWNPWLVQGNWSYKMSLGSLRWFWMPLGVRSMSGNWISEKIEADMIRGVHESLVITVNGSKCSFNSSYCQWVSS